MKKIAVLIGSNRKESFTKRFTNGVMKIAPKNMSMSIIEIEPLGFFNQDLEANPPKEWTEFREKIANYDGLLIFTPEYNRSYPAIIKNALDIASRPYGKGVLNGKPAAIISCTPGGLGGVAANQHLRVSGNCMGMNIMGSPETYIANVHTLIDNENNISNEDTKKFMVSFLEQFHEWVSKFSK